MNEVVTQSKEILIEDIPQDDIVQLEKINQVEQKFKDFENVSSIFNKSNEGDSSEEMTLNNETKSQELLDTAEPATNMTTSVFT